MTKREMAQKNLIIKMRTGSYLYGTNTQDSDEDFMGIFMPDVRYLLGLEKLSEVDLSIKDKKIDGKNTADAIDFKLYTLSKFIRLALDANPNIIEMLFVNDDNIVFINDVGKNLLEMRHKFVSKNIKNKFLGYASAQKHKMSMKLSDYKTLSNVLTFLECKREKEKYLVSVYNQYPLIQQRGDYVFVSDLQIPIAVTIKKAISMISDRLSKFGHRKELVSKYGYDTKFASHLIRLLKEGQELLLTGEIKFPLAYRELLLDIKEGKYSMIDVLEMANNIEQEIEYLYENTKVPNKPEDEYVEQFLIDTQKAFIFKA
jgi:uncharacterized protein